MNTEQENISSAVVTDFVDKYIELIAVSVGQSSWLFMGAGLEKVVLIVQYRQTIVMNVLYTQSIN